MGQVPSCAPEGSVGGRRPGSTLTPLWPESVAHITQLATHCGVPPVSLSQHQPAASPVCGQGSVTVAHINHIKHTATARTPLLLGLPLLGVCVAECVAHTAGINRNTAHHHTPISPSTTHSVYRHSGDAGRNQPCECELNSQSSLTQLPRNKKATAKQPWRVLAGSVPHTAGYKNAVCHSCVITRQSHPAASSVRAGVRGCWHRSSHWPQRRGGRSLQSMVDGDMRGRNGELVQE